MFIKIVARKRTGKVLPLIALLVFAFCPLHSVAQYAPGAQADAMHPSGAPDPTKIDQIWQVDPLTGSLSIKIPFNTTPTGGRGPKIPFALSYNSSSTVTLQAAGTSVQGSSVGVQCMMSPDDNEDCELTQGGQYSGQGEVQQTFKWSSSPITLPPGPTGPWTTTGPFLYSSSLSIPTVNITLADTVYTQYGCTLTGPFIYVDENGGSHDLNLNVVGGATPPGYPPCNENTATTATTSDGSALATSTTAPMVTYPDGTQLTSANTLEDSNGNISTLSKDSLGRTPFTTTIPIGHQGPIAAGTYSVQTTGATGTTEKYSIVFSTIPIGSISMPYPSQQGDFHIPSGACFQVCPNQSNPEQIASGSTVTGVTSISLPDGVSSYSFVYDPVYGTVSQINFPTGGYVRFVYGIRGDGGGYGTYLKLSTIVVTDAYLSDGTTGEQHWQYEFPSMVQGSGQLTSTVVSPDGTSTQHTGAPYTFSNFTCCGAPTWKETKRVVVNANNSTVKSVVTAYNAFALPTQIATTLYDGPSPLQQQVQIGYDANSNVIEKDESDFYSCSSPCTPPSTLSSSQWLRHTYTKFQTFSTYIVDKPSQVLVTNGSGAPVSLTNYTYDEPTHLLTTPTGLSTHDDANYGAGMTTPRGNVTTESKCITISGTGPTATCSSSWQTSYTYDLTGQLVSKTEGANSTAAATTSYTWGGNLSGYLMTVTHPNGATDKYTTSQTSGQMLTHVDWNSRTTTYNYTDPLNRLKSVVNPATVDGTTGSSGSGTTTYTYTDTPGAFSVQIQSTVDTAGTTTSTTKSYDGLGRVITTLTTSPNSSNGIEVDTAYDSMSRVASVSNPYYGLSDVTYGDTSFAYDALSRKIQTTFPDGGISTISYGANATEITDPYNGMTNVQHIQQVDGLGRLTSVCEVSAQSLGSGTPAACAQHITGTGYLTSYTYDATNNLLSVNQHGLARSFIYDSLSRLTQSLKPETGSTPDLYSYSNPTVACASDASLPCTKIDARKVITNYGYDNMNRLTSKVYGVVSGNTTGPISDLSSCYQYDTALSGTTDSNAKGQLTAEWQMAGSCSSSTSSWVNVRIRSNHDTMGRVGQDHQCLNYAACSATTGAGIFVYSYNLLGDPVQSNNGIYAAAVTANQATTYNSTAMTAPSVTWKTTYDEMNHIVGAVVQDQPTSTGTGPVWPASTFITSPTLLNATNYDPFGHMTDAKLGIPNASTTAAVTQIRAYDNRARMTFESDTGTNDKSGATNSIGTITINGSEQGPVYPASSYAHTTVTIGGVEGDGTFNTCPTNPDGPCPTQIPDTGTVTVTINGVAASSGYGLGSTPALIASNLAGSINSATNQVTATVSGAAITITSTTSGTGSNGLSVVTSAVTTESQYYSSPSFWGTPSSTTLTGGVNASKNVYDAGTIKATVNGTAATVSFSSTSTVLSLATALASAIQTASGSALTAKADGDINVLVSDTTGSGTDWTITTAVTYDTTDFSAPSFSATAYNMSDGDAADSSHGVLYSYFVPGGGYAPNGNLLVSSDSVMGDWYYSYDAVDRLMSATPDETAPSQYIGKYGCWTYDAYGNRTLEALSTIACSGSPTPQVLAVYNAANNRVTSISGNVSATFTYDAAGNTLSDAYNQYWYDAEGRLCAEQSLRSNNSPIYQYVYDAEGARVGKGTLTAAPGTSTATCAQPFTTGFTLATRYLVDLGGDQVTELNETSGEVWAHSNIWAGGKLTATYDTKGIHFDISDPLGTKRVQANAGGYMDEYCTSLPFGNDIGNLATVSCTTVGSPTNPLGTGDDATEHHFTGKERDTESGNDYFEARYYSSAMGRFLSPDWSAKIAPVPYAKLDDPQSLNLYAYVRNNPLSRADIDGHSDYLWQKTKNWLSGNGWKTDAQVKGWSVAQTAQNHVGSNDWAINGNNTSGKDVGHPQDFHPGQDKCNELVGDTLAEAGKTRPEITVDGKTRMPDAHELADPSVKIPGLSDTKPLSQAQPGDVIAQEHGDKYGHTGIVVMGADGKLATVSANATGSYGGQVTQNDWGFRPAGQNGESATDPAPVVRTPQ